MTIDLIKIALENPASTPMTLSEIITAEVAEYKASEAYKEMLQSDEYYKNRSDVQRKTNAIAKRSNTKIEHPILRKMINQKVDYLLAKPFSVAASSDSYTEALNELFDDALRQKIKLFGKNAVKHGIAFLQPYISPEGTLAFMRIPATELIPLWEDTESERLHSFIRFYDQIVYEGKKKKTVTRAEFWSRDGVQRFTKTDKDFIPDGDVEPHFFADNTHYNWTEVPLLWCRYNEDELPLLRFIKDLIDDINWQTSVTADALRDIAKFIYVLRNYGGQDLADFVKDLQEALAIKVDADGGVDKLQADVNIDAVMAFLDKQRRDVFDYAAGVDVKDKDLGNASGTAINFRYMDLDNDCAALGAELKSAFARMKMFIDVYFKLTGKGDFLNETFEITFNADMPVNETDIITNARNSVGLVSNRTILANHPWVVDVSEEEERIKAENNIDEADDYHEHFNGKKEVKGEEEQGILGGAPENSRRSPKPQKR